MVNGDDMNKLSQKLKLFIAISILWFIFAYIFIILDVRYPDSEEYLTFLLFTAPVWVSWLSFWIWGDSFVEFFSRLKIHMGFVPKQTTRKNDLQFSKNNITSKTENILTNHASIRTEKKYVEAAASPEASSNYHSEYIPPYVKKYFYSQGNENHGPFSLDEMKNKNIKKETLIWYEGLTDWTPAGDLHGFVEILEKCPPPIVKNEIMLEQLPVQVECPFCNELVELDEEEQISEKYNCPYCNKFVAGLNQNNQLKDSIGPIIPCSKIVKDKVQTYSIDYDGVLVEVSRIEANDKLIIQIKINGDLLKIIENQKSDLIKFKSKNGINLLRVEHEEIDKLFFINYFIEKGIAITINDIPVENSLADPSKKIQEGKSGLFIFLFLIIGKIIFAFLFFDKIYPLPLIIFTLGVAAISFSIWYFNKNPKLALIIGFLFGFLETAEYIYSLSAMKKMPGIWIILLFIFLRFMALYNMGKSISIINKAQKKTIK